MYRYGTTGNNTGTVLHILFAAVVGTNMGLMGIPDYVQWKNMYFFQKWNLFLNSLKFNVIFFNFKIRIRIQSRTEEDLKDFEDLLLGS